MSKMKRESSERDYEAIDIADQENNGAAVEWIKLEEQIYELSNILLIMSETLRRIIGGVQDGSD